MSARKEATPAELAMLREIRGQLEVVEERARDAAGELVKCEGAREVLRAMRTRLENGMVPLTE